MVPEGTSLSFGGEQSPLQRAAWDDDMAAARQLLDAGASPEEPDRDGLTPLWFAANCGSLGVLNLLLERGARVHIVDSDDDTPLVSEQSPIPLLPPGWGAGSTDGCRPPAPFLLI